MNYILFDGPSRNDLLPLTFTRPVADLRIGILTIREKWEKMLNTSISTKTEDYLSIKWPVKLEEKNIFINASYLPNKDLIEVINVLNENQKFFQF